MCFLTFSSYAFVFLGDRNELQLWVPVRNLIVITIANSLLLLKFVAVCCSVFQCVAGCRGVWKIQNYLDNLVWWDRSEFCERCMTVSRIARCSSEHLAADQIISPTLLEASNPGTNSTGKKTCRGYPVQWLMKFQISPSAPSFIRFALDLSTPLLHVKVLLTFSDDPALCTPPLSFSISLSLCLSVCRSVSHFVYLQQSREELTFVTWLIHVRDMNIFHWTPIGVWFSSLSPCANKTKQHTHTRTQELQRTKVSFSSMMWLLYVCDMIHSYVVWLIHMYDITHSCKWHEFLIHVIWHTKTDARAAANQVLETESNACLLRYSTHTWVTSQIYEYYDWSNQVVEVILHFSNTLQRLIALRTACTLTCHAIPENQIAWQGQGLADSGLGFKLWTKK